MMRGVTCALAASGLLLIAGCPSSEDVHPPILVEPMPDASMGGPADAHAPNADANDVTDASTDRTMTTRGLLATPVNNLLLDPFVTADVTWGHFRAVVPAVDPSQTGPDCPKITREFLSASPIGIAAPVVLVDPTVLPASSGCTAIIAPFVGSTEALSAQIWVSLSDASGAPVAIPAVADAAAGGLDSFLTVALVPSVLPSSAAPPASYPFVLASTPPTLIAGREWARLELSTPVSVPDGGWFAITLLNPASGFYLAAPQVVAASTTTLAVVRSLASIRTRPITDVERGAMLQYGRLLPVPMPRRRHRPKRMMGGFGL
jgi:hypothetical protein